MMKELIFFLVSFPPWILLGLCISAHPNNIRKLKKSSKRSKFAPFSLILNIVGVVLWYWIVSPHFEPSGGPNWGIHPFQALLRDIPIWGLVFGPSYTYITVFGINTLLRPDCSSRSVIYAEKDE
ncbi:hypothetical protein V22_31180 [Calycomorphotria hydatis]|uniref:Uncharacterized protein n=1 Tax=Calycomorphotria hydatis TaxID=2528027 RepID=A0A517TBU9_9PLAN|nr:hypothetical protein V22_31180 [Calycomorphotria hydatis]